MNKKRKILLTYSKDLIKKKNNFLLKYKKYKSDLTKRNVYLIIKKDKNNSKDKNRLPILKSLFGKEDALIIETTSIAKEYIILVAEFVKLTRSFDKNIKINLEEENKEFLNEKDPF